MVKKHSAPIQPEIHHHVHYRMQLQGMDKIKETAVKDKHFFINMDLGHHFP
jgi:hypothetical protein